MCGRDGYEYGMEDLENFGMKDVIKIPPSIPNISSTFVRDNIQKN